MTIALDVGNPFDKIKTSLMIKSPGENKEKETKPSIKNSLQ